MYVEILKAFSYSLDGSTELRAEPATTIDIPDNLVPGLSSEGYVRVNAGRAPETQAHDAPPETKDTDADSGDAEDLSAARARYTEVVGKQPYHGWDVETLNAKIADAEK